MIRHASLLLVLLSSSICISETLFAKNLQTPLSHTLISKETKYFGKRGRRGPRGADGCSGAGATGATGPTGATGSTPTGTFTPAYGQVFTFNPILTGTISFPTIPVPVSGITYNGLNTFTIVTPGRYRVAYYFYATSTVQAQLALQINGATVTGTNTSVTTVVNNQIETMMFEDIFVLNTGDTVRVTALSSFIGFPNNSLGSFTVIKLN